MFSCIPPNELGPHEFEITNTVRKINTMVACRTNESPTMFVLNAKTEKWQTLHDYFIRAEGANLSDAQAEVAAREKFCMKLQTVRGKDECALLIQQKLINSREEARTSNG